MAGVAQGIGFLGAGSSSKPTGRCAGSPAASLWTAAALGLSMGVGQYAIAAVGALLVVVTLHWLDRLEALVIRRRSSGPGRASPLRQVMALETSPLSPHSAIPTGAPRRADS
jgi:uncharacterized membrane protein YhiD involved in acid resistance